MERTKIPCQVCGRLLTTQKNGLTKQHNRSRRSGAYCEGTGYRHDRWSVGQLLRHHSSGVWIVVEDRGGEYGNYLIRCPKGVRSWSRPDEWLEEPGTELVTHGEYMHRHGWTPIEGGK